MKSSGVKVPFLKSFWRYNISASLASALDLALYAFLHYVLGFYYLLAAAIGAVAGAIVSFLLGRNWAFMNKEGEINTQGLKYTFTSGCSLLLNVGFLWLLVEVIGFDNKFLAKVIVSLAVGTLFNFPMQRFFIYK